MTKNNNNNNLQSKWDIVCVVELSSHLQKFIYTHVIISFKLYFSFRWNNYFCIERQSLFVILIKNTRFCL